ncbi:MAG: protease complex subunit PrcB family protein [Elusimicrobiota bacterium]
MLKHLRGIALFLSLAALMAEAAAAMCRRPPKSGSATEDHALTEWNGSFCSVTTAENDAVDSPQAWALLWRKIGKPAPKVDFSKVFAVAVFLGTRPTGGYAVKWEGPIEENSATVVRYQEKKPSGMTFEALTQPYAVHLYAKTALPIHVKEDGL